jgi:hypothetical protein
VKPERISERGRWGGKLTAHPLPAEDLSIDALTSPAREELARHWLARAASERRVGDSFAFIAGVLAEGQAPAALRELAERAVDDELRHTELSRQVASRFAGRDLPEPERLPLKVPEHPGASPALRRTLHIVGQCSLNETLASAVLEASLEATTGPLARAALRELLSDEIDHARIGWAHLASLAPAERAEVQPWLYGITLANVKVWRETEREYPSDERLISQGALSRALLERALLTAVRELVVPGFASLGFETAALQRWADAGAPG